MLNRRGEAGRWGIATALGVGVLVAIAALLVGGYVAKSKAGIDLMPNAHAKDVIGLK